MNVQTFQAIQRLRDVCAERKITILSDEEELVKGFATLRCDIDGNEWKTRYKNLTRNDDRASGCPKCASNARKELLRERGQITFDALLTSEKYTRLEPYDGVFAKLLLKCSKKRHLPFRVSPTNFKAGQRCPTCSNTTQHTKNVEPIARYVEGTTWRVERHPEEDGAILTCTVCDASRSLTTKHAKLASRRDLAHRECDCQRFGREFARYVGMCTGYRMVSPYKGSKKNVTMLHEKCGTTWQCRPDNFQKRWGTRCPTCARTGRSSNGQRQLADFVRSLGVSVEENVSGLDPMLPRTEVDIFLPEHGVAIEFDGVWWHAEGPSRDHAGRSRPSAQPDAIVARLERLRARGIYLLRVFSDEWIHERAMIETAIRAAVGQGEQTLDLTAPVLWLDRRLATRLDEETLQNAGYRAVATVPPVCQYVHPSASNRRVHFDSDDEAISQGYSRVWGSGYIEYHRN